MRGDISIRADSPTWGAPAHDLTEVIAALQALHPGFDGFDRDLAGQPFDAANPPVGPYAAPATLPMPPTWVEVPAIAGAPVSGEPLSLTEGYLMGAPYPARTQQWIRSQDGGLTWQAIAGATGPAYTPEEADEGWLIGADLAHGARTAVSAPVAGDYPLGTPELLTLWRSPGVATSIEVETETETFTATGRPLLVIASMITATGADATLTLTVGAPGRDMGAGTPLAAGPMLRRTSNQSHVFVLPEPPAGEVTVRMTASDLARCQQVLVFEVEGLAGIGAAGAQEGGTNATARALSVTTGTPDSGVLHIVNRYSGAEDNPITMTGVDTILSNATTGGAHATRDLTICVGWQRSAVPGTYTSNATWNTGATVVGSAIELIAGGGDG